MKSFFGRMLVIIVSLVLCLCLFSCHADNVEDTAENDSNESATSHNDDVKNLLSDIKKDPSLYEDKQITVKGWVCKREDVIILADYNAVDGAMLRYELEGGKLPRITICMSADKKAVLLDTGDYVNVTGTVKISENEIYLDDCDYEMIKSIYE
jgi:hypothetical protein